MKRKVGDRTLKKRQPMPRVPVTVRLPEAIVQQIDRALNHRDVPLSRNTWLLEAAIEKLKRAEQGRTDGTQ
jgi:hypothetical protein